MIRIRILSFLFAQNCLHLPFLFGLAFGLLGTLICKVEGYWIVLVDIEIKLLCQKAVRCGSEQVFEILPRLEIGFQLLKFIRILHEFCNLFRDFIQLLLPVFLEMDGLKLDVLNLAINKLINLQKLPSNRIVLQLKHNLDELSEHNQPAVFAVLWVYK